MSDGGGELGLPEGAGAVVGLVGLESQLLELADAAVMVVDLTGRVLYANRYAERLYGWTREEMVGRQSGELAQVALDPATEKEIAAALSVGSSWQGTFEVRRKGGAIVSVRVVDSPLYDASGAVVGVVSVALDASKERETEHLLVEQTRVAGGYRFLAECSTALFSSLDYAEGVRQLAKVSVPFLADMCLIDVVEEGGLRRVAAAHADPAKQALVDQLVARYAPDPEGDHPAVQAIRAGQSALVPEMTDQFLRAMTRDDAHLRLVRELGFESLMCVPLKARGRTLGALTLVSCTPSRRFGADDLQLAEEVARRAAVALDNARLYAERSHVARVLQASLLPPSLPVISGADLGARYVAAGEGNEVGGDFYDVFDVGYRTWAIAIGDVCGRGPEAAAITGLVRHTLRTLALKDREPVRVVQGLNDVLRRELLDSDLFCTLCFGFARPRPEGWRLLLASAGHPRPLILRTDGVVDEQVCKGPPLGLFADGDWTPCRVDLRAGEAMVLYTDGVTECRRDGELYGEERLAATLGALGDRDGQGVADAVIADVGVFAGRPPQDDMALLVWRSAAS